MKKVGLIIYGAIFALLQILNVVSSILTSSFSVGVVVSSVFTTLYLFGFYGYIFKKRFFNPKVWRNLFCLQCIALALQFLPLLYGFNVEILLGVGIVVLITIPMLVCLYRYSSPDSDIWLSASDREKAEKIEQLLSNVEEISASKTVGAKTTTVLMSKAEDGYVVHIKRISEETESFKNEFVTLGRAIEFIEKYASISSVELVEAYT
ncbi:hypothetical protein [Vibrio coralliilyticus]|uniref:hypothetical protein n=1 Tax=Vibrio coralliilyticus TaxID=190893 RepID=UPI001E4C376C|nr:hypothetical protein [Vibrio coralliilyticus]MCC2525711.1 hypothetical protein [Vibrio coralliilyticus]